MGLSTGDARHLLRRTSFGGLPHEIDALVGLSRDDAVDQALATTGAVPGSAAPYVDDLSQSRGRRKLLDWWVQQMLTTPVPIHERMVMFWHSHFACNLKKVNFIKLYARQHRTMRSLAFSDFHTLLQAMAVDEAMLIELDNAKNKVENPQENFARELMELHTIGNGNFTEDEVIDMARAWTGHGLTGKKSAALYHFHSDLHDHGDKTLFGITRNWDGPETITELVHGVRKEATAHYLARKLWREFGDPGVVPAHIVSVGASAMMAHDMRPLEGLRAMLKDPFFWEPQRYYAMVKPPVPYVVELARRFGVLSTDGKFEIRTDGMGQWLFFPPSVAGWAHNSVWLSSTRLLHRARYVFDHKNTVGEAGHFAGIQAMSTSAAADAILDRFGVPDASADTRAVVKSWVNQARPLKEHIFQTEAFRFGALLPEVNLA